MTRQENIVKVLLVDDDELDRRLVKLVLVQAQGSIRFNVDTAASLSEALGKMQAGSYDIILEDLNLADCRGTEIVEKVSATVPNVPIVVLTGFDDEEAGLEAIRAGAEDYLVKGSGLEYTLIKTIRYAIERKKAKASIIEAKHELEQTNARLLQTTIKANKLAQEAEKANVAKSQFLANISHEIRTPMNAIIGFGEVLAEEPLGETQKGYVNLILNSAKRLLLLINDILDFSRIEAGRMKVEKTECNIQELVANIESLMRPEAVAKNLEFNVMCAPDAVLLIQSDPLKIRQCLINLVSNAIKFTEKGKVELIVEPTEKNGAQFIKFDVRDTGIGIPADKHDAIFEVFTQADGSMTRKYGGTGLGLAVTRQLAKLLGGNIELVSEVGKGSTFTLLIPADVIHKDHNHRVAGRDELREYSGKFSGKVLVAEDSPANQLFLHNTLEKLGFSVSIVSDGQQAVEALSLDKFDLILMDMQLPTMTGFDAMQKLRGSGIQTPIIAMTASEDEIKCRQAGCDDFIAKPIDCNLLINILCKYLTPAEIVHTA
jgi:signal transduction histidine kinase